MRGQISLEYLLLSVVALALLSISLLALISIKDYSDKATLLYDFRSSALSLYEAINTVCAMGSGNERSVELNAPLSVEYQNDALRFSGVSSVVRPSRCQVETADVEGVVVVKNDGGKITFTKP